MIISEMLDYPTLFKIAEENHDKFANNKPFPHVHLKNFFNPHSFEFIHGHFPPANSEIWKTPKNNHTDLRSVTKQGEFKLKELLYDEHQRRILLELNSSLFLTFIEKLTGIDNLMPDPYFAEAAFVKGAKGGFLDIHADFSHHDKLKIERRINLLIYVTKDWRKEYGGQLKLFDEAMNLKKEIYPFENSIVIFETSETSFHGVEKIDCPEHMERRSIQLYYYSVPRTQRAVKKIFFPEDPSFVHVPTTD